MDEVLRSICWFCFLYGAQSRGYYPFLHLPLHVTPVSGALERRRQGAVGDKSYLVPGNHVAALFDAHGGKDLQLQSP